MKKYLAILTLGLLANTDGANAQMPYRVAVDTQPYESLTSSTNITDTIPWADTSNFVVPLGFTFKIGNDTTSRLNLMSTNMICSDSTGLVSTLSLMGTSLTDRGVLGGTSVSPIRYEISGAAGHRIFKVEFLNAGFSDEFWNHGTLDDSLNMQVWLREDSNIVEMRFGSSRLSYSDYFFFGGPLLGFIKNMDRAASTFDVAYLLSGSTTAPTIDSATMSSMSFPALSGYPDSGIVYRFIPVTIPHSTLSTDQHTRVAETAGTKVYPTRCFDKLFIDYPLQAATYKIMSLTGNVAGSGDIKSGLNTVDVGMLAPGMYVMAVQSAAGSNCYKFIKQ